MLLGGNSAVGVLPDSGPWLVQGDDQVVDTITCRTYQVRAELAAFIEQRRPFEGVRSAIDGNTAEVLPKRSTLRLRA